MNILKRLVLAGIILMLVATLFVFGGYKPDTATKDLDPEKKQELIDLAKSKYQQKKNQGTNFSNGPCLGLIVSNYVVDVAHNPRIKTDDDLSNQCPEILNGTAKHFIELDPAGNFIRME